MATAANRAISIGNLLPKFDPRSRPIYALLASMCVAAAVLLRALGFVLHASLAILIPAALLIFIGAMLRRAGHPRVATGMEGLALVYVQGVPSMLILVALTAISAPFADHMLSAADHALGFDWLTFVQSVGNHHWAVKTLGFAYRSFLWQSIAVFTLLPFLRQEGRAWQAIFASMIALCIVAAIYPFVPAEGAFVHLGITPAMFPAINDGSPWAFAPVIQSIKGGGRIVDQAMMSGLVSFPSFHCAAAAIFVWALWRTPLRIPALFLNALMCVSSLIYGAHYLVDVIGGIAVAAAALTISGKLQMEERSRRRCCNERFPLSV